MANDLANQVALVTGGGSCIGAALCHRLAARGAHIVVADLDEAGANAVTKEVGGMALHLDVSQRAEWTAGIATLIDRFGRLDLLALNAGVMSRPRGEPMDDDPWPWITERYDLVRGVNIDGVAYGLLTAMPHLAANGGHVAVTASGVGVTPLPADPIYSMTKHAVIGLVRSMALSLSGRGITIGAVCPGGVDTPMVSPELRATGREFASPDFIATALEMVLDLPADESGGIFVARVGQPTWRYEFAPHDAPPRPT